MTTVIIDRQSPAYPQTRRQQGRRSRHERMSKYGRSAMFVMVFMTVYMTGARSPMSQSRPSNLGDLALASVIVMLTRRFQ